MTGLYGPSSMSWRINRERAVLLVGGRAMMMQLAHPKVAAGVDAHSDFRVRPLRRLSRTVALSLAGVFGDTATAHAVTRAINAQHARVRGAGYRAMDPVLLTWVMATLVDSAVLGYELFVEPLTEAERDGFYAEARQGAHLLGAPESAMPPDFRSLRAYIRDMLRGEVQVNELSSALGRDTLYPPRLWWVPRAAFDFSALLTAGLLPPTLRRQFGLPWSRRHRAAFEVVVRIVRGTVPRLPRAVRDVPQARAALRRVA